MKDIKLLLLTLLLFVAGCGIRPQLERLSDRAPKIKAGLLRGVSSVVCELDASAVVSSHDKSFIARGLKGRKWEVRVIDSRPAETHFYLVAASMSTRGNAEKQVEAFRSQGFETVIIPIQTGIGLNANTMYRVSLRKIFASEQEAREYGNSIRSRLDTFVGRHQTSPATGRIRMTNVTTGQIFESSRFIRVKGDSVTLTDVPVGAGYHWSRNETRAYPSDILFQVDNDGKLIVINELSVEEYLRGVVPSEMHAGFPPEALKAQAIAARSTLMSKINSAHVNDPFDVCSDVHCQAYSGLSKRSGVTDAAILATVGQVLMNSNTIAEAVYSAVCGGHGESAENAWGGQGKPYLKGRYDGRRLDRYGRLANERHFKKWIDEMPASYCNSTESTLPALQYTKKYFRWTVELKQNELQNQLKKSADISIGPILNLTPLKRGVSGRIIQLRIDGRNGSALLEGELKIRRALLSSTLWSSAFYITPSGPPGFVPERFILKGAGWGHGVGMCQTGAAQMALEGLNYRDILNHYYPGTRIQRIY